MSDDVYARLINAFKQQEEQPNVIGTISSTSPLKIKIGSLEIDKDNILINPNLLNRKTQINLSGETKTEENHKHNINLKNQDIFINSSLKVGDEVFIYRFNQLFIVVCKVVSL